MVLVLGIVKASLEILGIGIGVKKVVLLMSDSFHSFSPASKLSAQNNQDNNIARSVSEEEM